MISRDSVLIGIFHKITDIRQNINKIMKNIRMMISLITLSIFMLVGVSNCLHSSTMNQKFNGSMQETLKAVEDKVKQKFQNPKIEAFKFLEGYKENTLQGKYTIIVNQKSEDCYFIPNLKPEQTLTLDFVVSYNILRICG